MLNLLTLLPCFRQEAFMATLLAMARDHGESSDWISCGSQKGSDHDDLDRYELWRVIKKQVKILREDMDTSEPDDPEPERDSMFHGKAEHLAQGKSAGMTLTRTVPFGKAEHGKIEELRSKNIPVFSHRLTPSEATLTLQTASTGDEKIWDWGSDPTR
jgi:hypothetical protein